MESSDTSKCKLHFYMIYIFFTEFETVNKFSALAKLYENEGIIKKNHTTEFK